MPEPAPDIAALFAAVFRDYVDDGVIASGVYQPEKTLLRQLGTAIADALAEKASTDLATAAAAGLLSPQLAAKLAGIADEANKYVHPTTDGSRHLPVTGAGDTARWLKSGAAAGAMAQWAVISKADIGLGQADNTPDALKPISNAAQAALNTKEDKSGKGAAGGYASLDAGGKIPSSQLPPIAISEPFVVASQAAMLALVAQTGDFAIRTDVSRTYILREEPASALVNWIEMATPAQGVMTVNDKPGPNVDISKADVGLGQADNTPDTEKPVSDPQQLALNAKADKAVKITAGEGLSGGGDLSANRALSLSADALAALTKANSAVQPEDLGDLADIDLPAIALGYVLDDMGNWVPQGGDEGGKINSIGQGQGIAILTNDPANPVVALSAATITALNRLANMEDGANKYVHPSTDGNRHLPVTGAGDIARWLKSGDAAGGAARWVVISKADIGLGQADDTSDADKPISNAAQAALNQKADLVGGKIPGNQLPALAITDTFPVASQAAMLALTAQVGDIAIRSDLKKSYVLRVEPANILANWSELLTPTDAVLSINNQTGAVVLGKGDVGLGNADNTSDANKPVSTPQQAALNGKLANNGGNFTGGYNGAAGSALSGTPITPALAGGHLQSYSAPAGNWTINAPVGSGHYDLEILVTNPAGGSGLLTPSLFTFADIEAYKPAANARFRFFIAVRGAQKFLNVIKASG